VYYIFFFFFFFQAEDGIRDGHVTGVQTCALPILSAQVRTRVVGRPRASTPTRLCQNVLVATAAISFARRPAAASVSSIASAAARSEERRVGKEWRSRWSADR